MLSTIQAIARQTAAQSPERFSENFSKRLQALAANQDLLVKSGWRNVGLEELVRGQLSHFGAVLDRRVSVGGPTVVLGERSAQAFAMALHELGTNAAKYGSLSNDSGRVDISWSADGESFRLKWAESGGPRIHQPARTGFGSTVIEKMIQSTLTADVSIDFAPAGFVWRVECSVSALGE
jgi:two-component sensor histidine kinase